VDKPKEYPPLSSNLTADVCIVGAGLAGVLTAYRLAKEGKKVVLLEKKKIGSGATEYTTAFLTQVIDTDPSQLLEFYSEEEVKQTYESHGKAIDFIENITKAENIDCEFMRCPNYIYGNDKKEFKEIFDEEVLFKKLGLKTSVVADNKLKFNNSGYAVIENQGKFHSLKFLSQLSPVLEKMGVSIHEKTEVNKIDSGNVIKVLANDHIVSAKDVIVATYMPFNNPEQTHYKKGMYVTYVMELMLPQSILPQAIYEDAGNPYHYFRVDSRNGHDRMIIGGEDHREEFPINTERNYNALKEYLNQLFPELDYKIIKKWTGPILEPSDGLALIGKYDDHQYVASAFSGNGMTYSAITAMLIPDLIMGKENAWAQIYDPKRTLSASKLFEKGKDYTGEFFGGAFKNLFKPKEPSTDA